jgi:hypothetical protein
MINHEIHEARKNIPTILRGISFVFSRVSWWLPGAHVSRKGLLVE